jgi:hypothetical protein
VQRGDTFAMEMPFDDDPQERVRQVWTLLAEAGIPRLALHTHQRHIPHLSLAVGPRLDRVQPEHNDGSVHH